MIYDPIKELNRENWRRKNKPYLWVLLCLTVPMALISLVILFGPAIDTFGRRHPMVISVLLICGSLYGIVKMQIRNSW